MITTIVLTFKLNYKYCMYRKINDFVNESWYFNFLIRIIFFRNHAEITKRMMEKIQEQTEIVEVHK